MNKRILKKNWLSVANLPYISLLIVVFGLVVSTGIEVLVKSLFCFA